MLNYQIKLICIMKWKKLLKNEFKPQDEQDEMFHTPCRNQALQHQASNKLHSSGLIYFCYDLIYYSLILSNPSNAWCRTSESWEALNPGLLPILRPAKVSQRILFWVNPRELILSISWSSFYKSLLCRLQF